MVAITARLRDIASSSVCDVDNADGQLSTGEYRNGMTPASHSGAGASLLTGIRAMSDVPKLTRVKMSLKTSLNLTTTIGPITPNVYSGVQSPDFVDVNIPAHTLRLFRREKQTRSGVNYFYSSMGVPTSPNYDREQAFAESKSVVTSTDNGGNTLARQTVPLGKGLTGDFALQVTLNRVKVAAKDANAHIAELEAANKSANDALAIGTKFIGLMAEGASREDSALMLLADGFDAELIARVSGLSVETLQSLADAPASDESEEPSE